MERDSLDEKPEQAEPLLPSNPSEEEENIEDEAMIQDKSKISLHPAFYIL